MRPARDLSTRTPLSKLHRWDRNYRVGDVQAIIASIVRFGFNGVLRVYRDGVVMAANHSLIALETMKANGAKPPAKITTNASGDWMVPTVDVTHLSRTEATAFALADNRTAELAKNDDERLVALLAEISEAEDGLAGTGYTDTDYASLLERATAPEPSAPREFLSLADRFLVPPFSVLDARKGYWGQRKAAWMESGIRSELGRGANGDRTKKGVLFSPTAQPPHLYEKKNREEERLGRTITWDEFFEMFPDEKLSAGDSIFDPVICKLAYRWFCQGGGRVLDPFAGGSVRGIVAGALGFSYTGVDIRVEQVEANRSQVVGMSLAAEPEWVVGDSQDVRALVAGDFDFILSCPPYADLEVYSDDPRDISTMEYDDFLAAYRKIIAESCALLRNDRFALFVVGDVRDKKGAYRNFVGDTVQAFRSAGLELYNDAVLITQASSLAIRAGRQFATTRKLGKGH